MYTLQKIVVTLVYVYAVISFVKDLDKIYRVENNLK